MGLNLLSDVLNSVLTQRLGNKITINPPGHVACNVPKYVMLPFMLLLFTVMLPCPQDTGSESNKYHKKKAKEEQLNREPQLTTKITTLAVETKYLLCC